MRAVVVGASGTIGKQVVEAFQAEDVEVIEASRNSRVPLNVEDPASIDRFFQSVGKVDAVAVALGTVPFVTLAEASSDDLASGIKSKLLGQLNVVVHALPYVTDAGSITLTTGILTQHPVANGVIAAAANGGVEAFVKAAVSDLPRGIRINAVSPTMLEEAREQYGESFKGFKAVSGEDVGQAFIRSAFGVETGQVFRVW